MATAKASIGTTAARTRRVRWKRSGRTGARRVRAAVMSVLAIMPPQALLL